MLEDVYYVPQLSKNLISVAKLVDTGYEVFFNKKECRISYKNRFRLDIIATAGIYLVRESMTKAYLGTEQRLVEKYGSTATKITEVMDINDLHRLHGHVNHATLTRMVKDGAILGITKVTGKTDPCEACIRAKLVNFT